MQQPILAAALEYARLGYRVIPLRPGTKVPDLRHWPEEASYEPRTVIEHFNASHARALARGDQAYPNVGIVTGGGLAVLDIDTSHDGVRPAWAVDTLTVRTASGGLHLYYAVESPVPNSVGRLARGVDVRGERGQVAAPPSIIAARDSLSPDNPRWVVSGQYKLESDRPIARLAAITLTPADQQQDYFGRRAHQFEWRDYVPVGERNNYLTSLAGYLMANGEAPTDVFDEVQEESDRLRFTPRPGEVSSIVRSVSRYHAAPAPGAPAI